MNIQLKYFGMLAEIAGKETEELTAEVRTAGDIRKWVENRYAGIKEVNFSIAIDQQLSEEATKLHEHAEVALFPPYAGG